MNPATINLRQLRHSSSFHQLAIRLPIASILLGGLLGLSAPLTRADESAIPHLEFNNYNLVNLSGKDFYRFLTGNDKTEREKAQMYMAGVWDSTEGKSWCEFRLFKSGTLQEMVYRYFDHLPPQRLNERAAKLIEEALIKNHACKATK